MHHMIYKFNIFINESSVLTPKHFKKGDVLVCVDNSYGFETIITVGNTYICSKSESSFFDGTHYLQIEKSDNGKRCLIYSVKFELDEPFEQFEEWEDIDETKINNNDELVIGLGMSGGVDITNQVGIVRDETDERYGVEFFRKFNRRQRKINGKYRKASGFWVNKDKVIFIDSDYYDVTKIQSSIIDFSSDARMVLPLHNIMTSDEQIDVNVSPDRDDVILLNGQELRVGRFFMRTLPFLDQNQVELLVNVYKYKYNDLIKNVMNHKIVKGNAISKWYLCDSYAEGGGNLTNSCMRYPESQRRLKIFTENPNKVKMLILTNADDKLLGRALIWNLDVPSNKKYMDRIFVCDDKYEQFFLNYIERYSILSYEDNEFESDENDIMSIYGNSELMEIYLDKNYGSNTANPCMDTFKCFYPDTNKLTNYRLKNKKHRLYIDVDF